MISVTYNQGRSIYDLAKTMQGPKTYLKWRSDGLTHFLVLFGADVTAMDLRDTQATHPLLDELFEHFDEFVSSKACNLKRLGIRCTLFTRNEMMRDGGMAIKETPGTYVIYGIDIENPDAPVIYTEKPQASLNLFTVTLDVRVDQSPVTVEQGFFKKKAVFSGYHKITLAKPFPELQGGILQYTVEDEKYPFPDEIVAKGGSFYVKADQHATIRFESKNRGIHIK